MLDPGRAIFEQIATAIEDQVIDGVLAEGARAPSTNELAAFYRINPATAAKGVNRLVDQGVLVKQRGIGMFVAEGARQRLLDQRRADFPRRYLTPLLAEAARLGLDLDSVIALLNQDRTGS